MKESEDYIHKDSEELDDREILDKLEKKSTQPTGRRQALQNLRRQLTDDELSSSGVQKLLLDILEESEKERDNLKKFVADYYEAEKKVAVLTEKLKPQTIIDIYFGIGVGIGGAIIGVSTIFFKQDPSIGWITLILGLLLSIGAIVGRAKRK